MMHGFNFSKPVVLPTLVSTYSNASNFHILQHQGLYSRFPRTHPVKLTVTCLVPDRAIKGKSQERLAWYVWTFNLFSMTNFKIALFQLVWFIWLLDASLVSSFVFWCGNPGCALMELHTCACNVCIISSIVINWQFRWIDHNGSLKPVSVLSPQ